MKTRDCSLVSQWGRSGKSWGRERVYYMKSDYMKKSFLFNNKKKLGTVVCACNSSMGWGGEADRKTSGVQFPGQLVQPNQ